MAGFIYHWKHGWIPLDHYAALQKAHGRDSGAQRIESRLGIGQPHSAPHTLKPGEHATVAGQDEYGQPIHFTGTVVSNGGVTVKKRGNKTGTPMRAIAVNRISAVTGNPTTSVVYVPDPNSPIAKDFRSMTSAQKIKAAEIMYGTGSKQHQAAKKKFGGK